MVYCKQLVDVSGAGDGKVMYKHWVLVVAHSIFAFVYGPTRVCGLQLSNGPMDQPVSNCLCLSKSQHAVVSCITHAKVSKTWVRHVFMQTTLQHLEDNRKAIDSLRTIETQVEHVIACLSLVDCSMFTFRVPLGNYVHVECCVMWVVTPCISYVSRSKHPF